MSNSKNNYTNLHELFVDQKLFKPALIELNSVAAGMHLKGVIGVKKPVFSNSSWSALPSSIPISVTQKPIRIKPQKYSKNKLVISIRDQAKIKPIFRLYNNSICFFGQKD